MKPILTEDGAHTFYVPELDEYYHSVYGAFQESKTVFIDAGFLAHKANPINIFEMGFGTGLNAYMTLLANETILKNVHYYSIEAYPIKEEDAVKLNYPKALDNDKSKALFNQMHRSKWGESIPLNNNFSLNKILGKIEDLPFDDYPKFDVIYFDAFAPSAQAHLWESAIIEQLYKALNPGGILVTYCAKGSFKRTLKAVGFQVEGLPGPKGKREMTRAVKLI